MIHEPTPFPEGKDAIVILWDLFNDRSFCRWFPNNLEIKHDEEMREAILAEWLIEYGYMPDPTDFADYSNIGGSDAPKNR